MFEELKTLVGDSERGREIVASLESTSIANVSTINALENKVSDITSTRDKFKSGNSLVKSVLGLDEVNEESLKAFMEKSKSKSGDDASIAEINNLKELLKSANDNSQSLAKDYEGRISTMALDNEIANSGIGTAFANDDMYKMGLGLIKNGATYEDGKIVYKKDDGSTEYNAAGTAKTISDKLSELKSNPNFSGMFKPDVRSGGDAPSNNKGGTGTKRFADYTGAELSALRASDPQAYEALKETR